MSRDASPLTLDKGHEAGPVSKRVKIESNDFTELDKFMSETENFFQPDALNMELENAIASCENVGGKTENPTEFSVSSTDASPYANLFDGIEPSESVSSEEVPHEAQKGASKGIGGESINLATMQELKESMASTSRLIATFTVLRGTYLKLCKEFNYLLGKFNENERIKIELIHENNQLRNLLFESIREKELDRKKYRADIEDIKAGCGLQKNVS